MKFLDDLKARFTGEQRYDTYDENYDDAYEGTYDDAYDNYGTYADSYSDAYEDGYGTSRRASSAAYSTDYAHDSYAQPSAAESVTVLPRSQRESTAYSYAARDGVLEAEESFAQLPRGPVPAARRSSEHIYDSSYTSAYESKVPSTSEPCVRKQEDFGRQLSKGFYLFEVESYNQAELIVKRLKQGQQVAVSLKSTRVDVAKRILDFCFGAIFALDGRVEKVGDKVFVFSPNNQRLSQDDKTKLSRL